MIIGVFPCKADVTLAFFADLFRRVSRNTRAGSRGSRLDVPKCSSIVKFSEPCQCDIGLAWWFYYKHINNVCVVFSRRFGFVTCIWMKYVYWHFGRRWKADGWHLYNCRDTTAIANSRTERFLMLISQSRCFRWGKINYEPASESAAKPVQRPHMSV